MFGRIALFMLVIAAAVAIFACSGVFKSSPDQDPQPSIPPDRLKTAVFAGGCFWCMEPPFEKLPGVTRVDSGYTGGTKKNPTYKEVTRGGTGHVEAVRVTYDATRITYDDLLEVFWRNIDPTDGEGQFVDRGDSYLSAIFVASDEERVAAERSRADLEESRRFEEPIVTPIRDALTFYLAEEYHQDYYEKNPLRYKYYRNRSGRDQFIDARWGDDRQYTPRDVAMKSPAAPGEKTRRYSKPEDTEIRARLTALQYRVTRQDGTEPPFENKYWDNVDDGIYVDIVSGEPLFSSRDKYKSGTGWPSFTRPLVKENIVERDDYKLLSRRTEVRSKHGDSHLGHVFRDGPAPTGLRYCMNSAALRFIPVEELEAGGYGEFRELFDRADQAEPR